MIRNSLAVFALLMLVSNISHAIDTEKRTSKIRFKSQVMDERREVFVRLPRGYDAIGEAYPVIYVLDGEWNFELVAAYLDFYMEQGLYPDVIVTAVRNVDRNRDYVGNADPRFPRSGGADQFLQFVESEWTARIDKKFNTSDQRVLVGHSFGGTFTLHTLFEKPELFDAYIAISASTWVADRYLFNLAEKFFASGESHDNFVYMAVGEADGGATVPDGRLMAQLFADSEPAQLEWRFEELDGAEHFLAFSAGMDQGFRNLFPRWQFEKEVGQLAREHGSEGVAAWFAAKEKSLGWRFRPSWFEMGVESIVMAREGYIGVAPDLIDQVRRYHPDNPIVLSFSGAVHTLAGSADIAEKHVLEAIEITRRRGLHPNWIQLENLQQQLDRLRAPGQTGQ